MKVNDREKEVSLNMRRFTAELPAALSSISLLS